MLETIAEFALEQLESTGEADALRRRHAEHFLALGETANLTAESDGPERAEIVRGEQDNFRAAIDWALDRDPELAFRLTICLEQFWVMNDAFEGVRRLKVLLEHSAHVPPLLRARARRVYAESAFMAGDFDTGARAQEESLREFRELGDEPGIAIGVHRIAVGASQEGDLVRARELLDECLEICRRRPNPKLVADVVREARHGRVAGRRPRARAGALGGRSRPVRSSRIHVDAGTCRACPSPKWPIELGRTELAWQQSARGAPPLPANVTTGGSPLYSLALLAPLEAEAGGAGRAGGLWGAIETEEDRAAGRPLGERARARSASIVDSRRPSSSRGARRGARCRSTKPSTTHSARLSPALQFALLPRTCSGSSKSRSKLSLEEAVEYALGV